MPLTFLPELQKIQNMTKNTKFGDKFDKYQEVCTFLIINKDNRRKWKEIIFIVLQQRIFEVKLLKKIATT